MEKSCRIEKLQKVIKRYRSADATDLVPCYSNSSGVDESFINSLKHLINLWAK